MFECGLYTRWRFGTMGNFLRCGNVMWLCRRISLCLEFVEVFNSDVISAKYSQMSNNKSMWRKSRCSKMSIS